MTKLNNITWMKNKGTSGDYVGCADNTDLKFMICDGPDNSFHMTAYLEIMVKDSKFELSDYWVYQTLEEAKAGAEELNENFRALYQSE